jgi:O-antigen ligase
MLERLYLDKTYQYLLISLAFFLPLSVFIANSIIVIIVLIWLFSGEYRQKINQIINNKLLMASIIFFSLHVLGLLWTEDIVWGLNIVHKMWYFLLLFPILHSIVKRENIKYYLYAFLLAISLTELISYLIWFEIIPPFKNATVLNPTPFMSHISYNPILAFAIYFVLHKILFDKNLDTAKFIWLSFFAVTMSINMFITGGRAGQVMFFAMLVIIIFQFFSRQRIKALILVLTIIPSIFFVAYQSSPLFHDRVDLAIHQANTFEEKRSVLDGNSPSSVGIRLNFAINSLELIKKNPWIGVGTGDFPSEYNKINNINSPNLPGGANPHNMYILVLAQLGLIGLVSMLSIFYYQLKLSSASSIKFIRDAGVAMPLLFLIIMLSDSYLLGHYTTLMFVFFSSFLYNNFEKS